MSHDPEILLDVMTRAAAAGARRALAVTNRRSLTRGQKTDGEWDIVTEVDRESQSAISDILRGHFPDVTIVAEESGMSQSCAPEFFTIDPLDGTWDYANGGNQWGVLVGYIRDNRPEAGVLLQPEHDITVTSAAETGCRINGKRISFPSSPEKTAVISSGPWLKRQDRLTGEVIPTLLSNGFRLTGAPCATACTLAVLMGEASVYFGFGEKIWDVTPGAVAVMESGGTCRSTDGRTPSFDVLVLPLIMAASRGLEEEVSRLLMRST